MLTLSFGCVLAFGQSAEEARRLVLSGDYEGAKAAYERLVKRSPNNASYGHWYGVCCYETGDWATAEKYLEAGVKRRVRESYRYLAEVYAATYRFGEAAGMYETYIKELSKAKAEATDAKERLRQVEKWARMMERVEGVRIIDSVVVDKDSFLSAYVLSEEAGSLAWYRDFFQTAEGVTSVVYKNEIGDKIFYAEPWSEEEGDRHYALFSQSRLLDNWGDEQRLPANVNTPGNDCNYPFVMPDGVTLYYASKGEGSMGGYDLFVTRYNSRTDAYLAPEQLGMPYNSFANDYMLVIDEAKGLGWFASDRRQPEGKVCVYLFIPDEQHSRVASDNKQEKRRRAALMSIADTWEANADYSELVRRAHSPLSSAKAGVEKRDFEFIVRDGLVYYTLKDFRSSEARESYEKALSARRQIAGVTAQLSTWRESWDKGNKAKRAQLKESILEAEAQLDNWQGQPAEWEKKARNAEIIFLQNNTHPK